MSRKISRIIFQPSTKLLSWNDALQKDFNLR